MSKSNEIRKRLRALGTEERAEVSRRFFKTASGEYGEGDLFIGVTVPDVRRLVKEFREIDEGEVLDLLRSPVHEERLFALLSLVHSFKRGDGWARKRIYNLYLDNTKYVNNWDLVDVSAEHIVGAYLAERQKEVLTRLAVSPDLWERRIAVMATFHYIKMGDFGETLKIAEILLGDGEDLIHKAVGWMLREVGKRDMDTEEGFLVRYYKQMPRTMLRYAIERFPEEKRQGYLKGMV